MALKFYLFSTDTNNGGKEIYCDTNATITEVAGSVDLGTMDLEWNECKHAIFPNTPFFIVDTSETPNKVWSYIVSQDNVEVVSKNNPVKYLHTLSLSQKAHKLNFHQLRNTYFSQPYDSNKTVKSNHAFGVGSIFNSNGSSRWHDITTWDGSCHFATPLNSHSYLSTYFKTSAFASNKTKIQYAKIQMWDSNQFYDEISYDGNFSFSNWQSKEYREETWQTAHIRIVQANNSSNYIDIYLDKSNGDTVYLTQEQCEWLSGKEVYIQPIDMTISRPTHNSLHVLAGTTESSIPWSSKIYNILGFLHITLTANSYYYSLYDVLETIEKQCRKEHNGLSKTPIYTMPSVNSEKGKILKETIAPEFKFNDLDLFSAVVEVLSYIDAFPLLTSDGTLDFEYLNDLSKDEIVDLEVSDKKVTLNEENFANKMISTYQNSKQENIIYYPSEFSFKYPTGSSFGVPSRDDYWMTVDKPIDYLDRVLLLAPLSTTYDILIHDYPGFIEGSETTWSYENYQLIGTATTNRIDITRYCLREDAYWLLPNDFANNDGMNLYNTLRYTKGDKKIYLGVTGQITNQQTMPGEYDALIFVVQQALLFNCGFRTWSQFEIAVSGSVVQKENVKYNISYHAIFEGRTAQESTTNKYEGEIRSAQQNAGGEINRMGNNMQGLLARLGNEEKSITFPITSLNNKVKIGTLWEDENGNDWLVNQIKTSFTTREDKVICEATLTKDFNRIQQFTRVNQEKRFYEVDDNLTTKGFENINEFLYFTNRDINISSLNDTQAALSDYGVLCLLDAVFNSGDFTENYGTTTYKTGPYTRNGQSAFIKNKETDQYFYIPLHVYGCGNAICFEMGFDSPNNAGNRTVSRQGTVITEAVIYDGDHGFIDNLSFTCYDVRKVNTDYELYYEEFTKNFPLTTLAEIQSNYHTVSPGNDYTRAIFELDYEYLKKPNEILHLNYSVNFLPYWRKTTDSLGTPIYTYDEIFFGNQMIDHNPVIPGIMFDNSEIYLYTSSKKMSFKEESIDSTDSQFTLVSRVKAVFSKTTNHVAVPNDSTDEFVKLNGDLEFKTYNGENSIDVSSSVAWLIVDKNNNILISVNKNDESMSNAKLKFFKSRIRKVENKHFNNYAK